jgi:hypothetical protein
VALVRGTRAAVFCCAPRFFWRTFGTIKFGAEKIKRKKAMCLIISAKLYLDRCARPLRARRKSGRAQRQMATAAPLSSNARSQIKPPLFFEPLLRNS